MKFILVLKNVVNGQLNNLYFCLCNSFVRKFT